MDNTNAFIWNVWFDIMKCNIDTQDSSFIENIYIFFRDLGCVQYFGVIFCLSSLVSIIFMLSNLM